MALNCDHRVHIAAITVALLGCAEEPIVGGLDASERMRSTPFSGAADAAAVDADGASRDSPDAGVQSDLATASDPFQCKKAEPCGVLVVVPGDCRARMPAPCSEREESSLAQRLQSSCGYDPSYNPLELSFEGGCVATFRYAENSKTDRREVVDCLSRDLAALRFDCADGGRLLLYRDTLALP